jgi:integrase
LPVNVARGLGKQFRNGSVAKQVMQPLDSEQIRQFLETVPKEWYCFCLLLFRTGVRLGEALGIAWKDVDFKTKKLCVQRAYTHSEWTSPKSGKIRYVNMTKQLIEALKKRQTKLGKGIPIRVGGDVMSLVFADERGQPINDKILRRVWKATLKKCGLPAIRIHDARHSFASLLLMKKLPVLFVQQQLGHASAKTTLDKYGHYVPTENLRSTNVLDD